MAMAWTEMQQQAIFKRGKNYIVSAGAGSGKTAVLSERILQYCLDGKDICSFLILTFTNAAAKEMKERIRKKLLQHHLTEQASRVDSAFITTFDAYSLALAKKYYFYLGVDKDITIIDQALLEVKKKDTIEGLFEELYACKNEQFLRLLSKYTKQNDENVKKMILSIVSKLELIVDEEEFYRTYEEKYYHPDFIKSVLIQYNELVMKEIDELYLAINTLMEMAEQDQASIKLAEDLKNILALAKPRNYDEAILWMNQIAFPRINPKASDQVKEQKTICSDLLKSIKLTYFSKYTFLEEAKEELYAIREDVLYLLKLAFEVKNRVDAYKLELMAFDYMDIAKMVIRLVKTNPFVQKEIQDSYTEILIDEYQDTSDIQEAFISYIAKDNCYMVGDIKQSIYRFRNANPYIFKDKYFAYTSDNGGRKIDLTHNFRSRKEVLEDINLIFSNLMTLEYGDANYAFEHIMRYGQVAYDTKVSQLDYHMNILTYDAQEGYTDEEVEAFICGKKIKELLAQQRLCLKGDSFKPLEYADIAILIDKTKSFITFKRVFEYLGIPLSIEADLDLNDSILPKLFSNIFLLIVKTYEGTLDKAYEHALVSVGRSFLFEYEDSKLYSMIKNHEENDLVKRVVTLAMDVENCAIEELYYKIVETFEFYEKLSLIGDVQNSCVVLEYIHSLFCTIASAGMGLKEACDYFVSIFENGIALKYKSPEDSKNCVHLMTIHKSKGLEFPYCFFPMLGSKFNQADLKENFGLSTKYGLYIPFSDEANSNTILKTLVDEETRKEDLSEKLRLFYVALTRAREQIILISKNMDLSEPIKIQKVASFNQLLYTKLFFKDYHQPVDIAKLELSLNYRIKKHSLKNISGQSIVYQDEQYQSESMAPQAISKELVELTDSNLKRALELGKQFHECLEVLDFNHPQIDELPIDSFMKQTLYKVLESPVFQDIKKAKTYHEHEFYFQQYHGIIDLLCVYKDHVDIIDYKLSGTKSQEYLRQLGVYKTYVENQTNLPVNCYLLSILKQEVKKVL